MSIPRFFVDPAELQGPRAEVRGEEYHHLSRVRRLRRGAAVEVADGRGRGFRGRVEEVGGGRAVILLEEEIGACRESPLAVRLYQGLPSCPASMDQIVSQATELGLALLVPVITGRSRGALLPDPRRLGARLTRWQRIARDACKSSGRLSLPEIRQPLSFAQALDEAAASPGIHLIPAEGGGHPAIGRCLALPPAERAGEGPAPLPRGSAARPPAAGEPFPGPSGGGLGGEVRPWSGGLTLLVGPEGGWEAAELASAVAAGFRPVSLGPRVLRAETAAVATLAAVQLLAGDLA